MTIHTVPETGIGLGFAESYLEALALVERLRQLLFDVVRNEFERVNVLKINPVQALLFNIGENEVTPSELRTCRYYQGISVSYNLKKMVEMGYMLYQRSEIDRRSVRVRLAQQGRDILYIVADLFLRHADGIQSKGVLGSEGIKVIATALRRVERYWTDQIRCIYQHSSRS